jgi:NAD-dependent dihydropyrimidine dehydrogenase PreA subunit
MRGGSASRNASPSCIAALKRDTARLTADAILATARMTRRRLPNLDLFEQAALASGRVAGIDEAGRGPLAGPVVAAAVILDPARRINGLRDSKLLTAARREQLEPRIKERAMPGRWPKRASTRSTRLNILQATLLAMRRAVDRLHSGRRIRAGRWQSAAAVDYPGARHCRWRPVGAGHFGCVDSGEDRARRDDAGFDASTRATDLRSTWVTRRRNTCIVCSASVPACCTAEASRRSGLPWVALRPC